MKILNFFGLIALFINAISAKTLSNADKKADKYYLIYVNNVHGEYQVLPESRIQKRQESQVFVESLVNQINDLIVNNRDTYKNPEKLDEIEETARLQKIKRSNKEQDFYPYDESSFVYPVSSVKERVVLYAYLSDALLEQVGDIDNVMAIEENTSKMSLHQYYNVEDILEETHWKNVTVREKADLHLSLLSQGKYDSKLAKEYDPNYYYPSSAGKDIDIVILDSSFHFDYSEFSNTDDRTVKCSANVKDGRASTDEIDYYCGSSSLYHGETVSDTAAGLKHGSASRANVYGVSIPVNGQGQIEDVDIIGGLQFIYEHSIRAHKTVVNMSLGGGDDGTSQYYEQFKSLVKGITEKGGIVVASAGNDGKDIGKLDYYQIPCVLDGVLCVGGTESKTILFFIKNYYNVSVMSNYGKGVHIYAPFHVEAEILKNNKVKKVSQMGTSFSSPLVAGLVATIMGENPEINFTRETIYERLYEYGKTERVVMKSGSTGEETGILANNGKHIVYSKNGKYGGCGIYAGNRPCN